MLNEQHAAGLSPSIKNVRSNLRQSHRRRASLRYARLFAATGIAALLSSIIVPSSTETAVANGDTRTLYLYHSHTGESIQATFRINGSYDQAVLEKLNYFLRDWRNNDVTRMDPRLFDVIWEAYRTAGATTQPIVIVSAYRSPQTNAMLRRRSRSVAEHSQHILGRAMDTTMPGMPMERIREIGMRLQRGGVGWYPSSNFVHLDVGGVRSWPRMSYDQLVRLFPDGKTVHLAADGRTLSRYQEARAEIAERGGVMSDVPQEGAAPFKGLFAWLFGKHDEDEEADSQLEVARSARARHGGTEVAALRASASSSDAAAPPARADGGSLPGAPASPATDMNAPSAPAEVADLGAAAGSNAGRAAKEESRSGAQVEGDEASLKAKTEMRAGSAASVPLPPHRPGDFGGIAAIAAAAVPVPPARPGDLDHPAALANVPAPPARPDSPTRLAAVLPDKSGDAQGSKQAREAINDADAAASQDSSLARAASLPVVITQGPQDHPGVPKQVLAFASGAPVQNLQAEAPRKPLDSPAVNAPSSPPAAAARPERIKLRGPMSNVSTVFPAQSLLGQPLTGLRRAARIIPDLLSSTPSADYVSSFGPAASDLDPSHFTGTAAKPLALAQGFVRLTASPAPAQEN
jgi:uncharacterized protein YcbK (DUF882 family)